MRKLALSCSVLAALVAAPLHSDAAGRTATATYTTPGGVAGVIQGDTEAQGSSMGAVSFVRGLGEHTVSVTAHDTSGLPVAFNLAQENGTLYPTALGSFCGSTGHGVGFSQTGGDIVVYIEVDACAAGPSVPTTGKVTATFR